MKLTLSILLLGIAYWDTPLFAEVPPKPPVPTTVAPVGAQPNPAVAPAVPPVVETAEDLKAVLVDQKGNPITVYPMDPNLAANEVLFQPVVPSRIESYVSWTFEINERTRNLTYRVGQEGEAPSVIHWDGVFNNNKKMVLKEKYFFRLVLTLPDKHFIASQWAVLSTVQKSNVAENRAKHEEPFCLIPTGGVDSIIVKTQGFSGLMFPSLFGDFRFVVQDVHTLALRFEATTNALYNTRTDANGLFYSDFSISYRYRLAGAPLRSPILPVAPPYGNRDAVFSPSPDAYGAPFNAEAGIRFFNTVLRGYGNYPVDEQLGRYFRGISGTINADLGLGPFRLYAGGEAGFSVFRGKIITAGLEGALTYDRFQSIAPGIHGRLTYIMGTPAPDDWDAVPPSGRDGHITNILASLGLIMFFKL